MLNFLQRTLLQNCQNLQNMRVATMAYQFRVERASYYPNRDSEMQRINEQSKSQLVTETQTEQKKLPKDYYYKILGVRRHASMQQIKTAYYALAKRFHPDTRTNGAAERTPQETKRFQDISNAYHILTDETKRLEYDQMGVVKDEQSFLNTIVNKNRVAKQRTTELNTSSTREELIRMTNGEPQLELTFLEAAHGLKKNLDLRFLKKCPTCGGKSPKMVSRSASETCRKCNGTGQLTKKTPTYTSLSVCDQCQGKRYINRNQCEMCDNRGFVLETIKVVVPVPPGGKSGDVVTIDNPKTKQRVSYRLQVQKSDYFVRVGNDVHTDKYLTISEAVLGGTFRIRGLHDTIEVKVEPGTESHTSIVLRGKGIKMRDGSADGNHIVTFKVRIPRQLSMKQRQLILALSKAEEPLYQTTTET